MLYPANATDAPHIMIRQNADGQNALMQAAAHGHDSIVGLLLEAGVPWNAIDKKGNCAGDLAVAAAHESTAELLLKAGTAHCMADFSLRFHESIPDKLCFAPALWLSENG